jgi:metallo-beta-lactamase class B
MPEPLYTRSRSNSEVKLLNGKAGTFVTQKFCNRRLRIGTSVVAFLIFTCVAIVANAQSAQQPRRGQWSLKPFKLIGNIYYVGLSNNTSFLITTPQGNILLDPTIEPAAQEIRKNIEQLGFHMKDIKIILQAHAHGDHVGGLAEMKELTGAKVLVMQQDAEVLADGGKSDFRGGEHWKPVRADKTLRDGEKVQLGGVTMVAHLTAGHTKGCTTWTTVAEEDGKKYNVVFVCSVRMNTGVPMVGNAKYPNMAEDFANAFKTLRSLPCDVFLVSHGNMFDLEGKIKRMEQGAKPNPFIDPEGYKKFVAEYEKAYLDQLQQERAGGRPYAVSPAPPGICPQDGRTCYGASDEQPRSAPPNRGGA